MQTGIHAQIKWMEPLLASCNFREANQLKEKAAMLKNSWHSGNSLQLQQNV